MVQGGMHEGDRGRQAVCCVLKCFRLLLECPHARVPAERRNFSSHASIFLVYSRCSFPREPT
jgi:hypothetical protein